MLGKEYELCLAALNAADNGVSRAQCSINACINASAGAVLVGTSSRCTYLTVDRHGDECQPEAEATLLPAACSSDLHAFVQPAAAASPAGGAVDPAPGAPTTGHHCIIASALMGGLRRSACGGPCALGGVVVLSLYVCVSLSRA